MTFECGCFGRQIIDLTFVHRFHSRGIELIFSRESTSRIWLTQGIPNEMNAKRRHPHSMHQARKHQEATGKPEKPALNMNDEHDHDDDD